MKASTAWETCGRWGENLNGNATGRLIHSRKLILEKMSVIALNIIHFSPNNNDALAGIYYIDWMNRFPIVFSSALVSRLRAWHPAKVKTKALVEKKGNLIMD